MNSQNGILSERSHTKDYKLYTFLYGKLSEKATLQKTENK